MAGRFGRTTAMVLDPDGVDRVYEVVLAAAAATRPRSARSARAAGTSAAAGRAGASVTPPCRSSTGPGGGSAGAW
jgi:hypothetical protein